MKNNNVFKVSLVLFFLAIILHLSCYFTNYGYVLLWILWMPAIFLFLIAIFKIKNNYNKFIKFKVSDIIKNKYFIIFILMFIYGNIIFMISYIDMQGISKMIEENGKYYIYDSNGEKIKILYSEFRNYSLINARMLSSHLPAFYSFVIFADVLVNKLSRKNT